MRKPLLSAVAVSLACVAATIPSRANVVTDWNEITLRCVQGPVNPHRAGPPGLLDIALVQAAVHDAVQTIEGRYEAYQYSNPALAGAGSVDAAAAAAAYGVLVGLYHANDPCLAGVVDPADTYPGDAGLQAGAEAADAMLPLYRPFFTTPIDPFLGGTEPGEWRPTPGVTQGANTFMAYTTPFTLDTARQFRPEAPPPLTSTRYAREYDEVKALGSASSTARTAPQTDMARFWSANFIAQWFGTLRAIGAAHVTNVGDSARLFALVGFATADSQIAVYDTKYHYNYWRPYTAIREGDFDNNANTVGDPDWTPLIGTPPYPDYSSGANNLTAAATTIMQLFFGTDEFSFSVSSTTPGLTVNPRLFQRFSAAQQEVVEVRILQGIHFRSADESGRRQGARIASWAYVKFLRPVKP